MYIGYNLQIGSDKNPGELGDHVVIQSIEVLILGSDSMLIHHNRSLTIRQTAGDVINRKPDPQRFLNSDCIRCFAFVEFKKLQVVHPNLVHHHLSGRIRHQSDHRQCWMRS